MFTSIPKGRSLVCAAVILLTLSGCAHKKLHNVITPTSEVAAGPVAKVQSVLMVELYVGPRPSPLLDKQQQLQASLRAQLRSAGVTVDNVQISEVALDPDAVVVRAIAVYKPTHVMDLRVSGAQISTQSAMVTEYSIRTTLVDVRSKTRVWKYAASVTPWTSLDADEVTSGMLQRMEPPGATPAPN
jgi:hypothetical protein